MKRIAQLKEQRARAIANARRVIDEAGANGRKNLSPDEEKRVTGYLEEADRFTRAVEEEEVDIERRRLTAASAGQWVGGMQHDASAGEFRELIAPVEPEGRLVRTASVPLEFRTEYPLATSDSTYTHGAYLARASLSQRIVYTLVAQSGVLECNPTTIRTTTGEDLTVPVLASELTAAYRAQGSPATQDSVDWTTAPLKGYNLAGYTEVTAEFLRDCRPEDADTILSNLCGRALGVKLANELAAGDGTDHIEGVFNAPTTGKTAASSTTFTADELLQLRASVSAPNRKAGRWLFSDTAYSTVALLLKDDEGHYLLDPTSNTLFGQPVAIDAYGPACSAGNAVALYGDFQQAYAVRYVGNIEITRSDQAGQDKFVSWIATYRFQQVADADWLDKTAVKALKLKA